MNFLLTRKNEVPKLPYVVIENIFVEILFAILLLGCIKNYTYKGV